MKNLDSINNKTYSKNNLNHISILHYTSDEEYGFTKEMPLKGTFDVSEEECRYFGRTLQQRELI